MPSVISSEEQALLDAVADRTLRRCLDNLRPAIEGLWRAGAPRIIQDFTDHGVEHCERIAAYATSLLAAKVSETKALSAVEIFLLLGGIYLHDVGMQCDVTTEDGREIKKRAEALGACFGVQFTASSANSYSLDEQKAIRKNHHYLSAAWIEYANETGKTVLGPVLGSAAGLLQFDLVPDLMDVCLHHTSCPIKDCSTALAGAGNGRKQLVAALLRFADELDISSNRVDMAAVTQFAVNPENALYWWLHNLTEVTFTPPNAFKLTVRLRKTEFDEYAPLVRAFSLEKFQTKNQETLGVLKEYNFPVVLDAYGAVVPLLTAPALPEPVKAALKEQAAGLALSPRTERGREAAPSAILAGDDHPLVFLAEVPEHLDKLRDDVRQYLEQQGVRVVPERSYQRAPTRFKEQMERELRHCEAFLQLLDERPWPEAEGLPRGYIGLQYDCAFDYRAWIKRQMVLLQWRRREVDVEAVRQNHPDYAAFLDGPYVQAESIEDFKRAAIKEIKRCKSKREATNRALSQLVVFLNADDADRQHAEIIGKELLSRGLGFYLLWPDESPEDHQRNLEMALSSCDALFIVYGMAKPSWVFKQIMEARKYWARRDHPVRAWVLVDSPPPHNHLTMPLTIQLPNLHRLDCQFKTDPLHHFLDLLEREAEQM